MKKLTDVNKCSRYYKLSIRSLNRQHSCHCTKPPSYKALSEELNKKIWELPSFQRAFLSWRSSVSVESAVVLKFREEILKGQHQVAIVLPRSLLSIQHETLLLNEERWSAVLIVNQVTSIKTSNIPEHQH